MAKTQTHSTMRASHAIGKKAKWCDPSRGTLRYSEQNHICICPLTQRSHIKGFTLRIKRHEYEASYSVLLMGYIQRLAGAEEREANLEVYVDLLIVPFGLVLLLWNGANK